MTNDVENRFKEFEETETAIDTLIQGLLDNAEIQVMEYKEMWMKKNDSIKEFKLRGNIRPRIITTNNKPDTMRIIWEQIIFNPLSKIATGKYIKTGGKPNYNLKAFNKAKKWELDLIEKYERKFRNYRESLTILKTSKKGVLKVEKTHSES